MSVEILHNLSTGCFVLAGILCVAAVILFIAYGIPAVIGKLSGARAGTAGKELHRQQEAVWRETSDIEACGSTTALRAVMPQDGSATTVLYGTNSTTDAIVIEYEIGFWSSTEWIE